MKNQFMNLDFQNEKVIITYAGKQTENNKEEILLSLEKEIADKNFIMNDEITREDIGDFIYYQFFYFDGTCSRNVRIKISKNDVSSIRRIDMIRLRLENNKLKEDMSEIIFDDEKMI